MSELKTYEVKQKEPKFGLINIVLIGINLALFTILAAILLDPTRQIAIVIGKGGLFTILFGLWVIVLGLVIARKRKQKKAANVKENGKPKD